MSAIFGNKIRKLREVRSLSQLDLAHLLGYTSSSYISDYEKGLFVPSSDRLRAIARALGVPHGLLEEIAAEARIEELGIRDPGFVAMFKDYPRLSKKDKQAIVATYHAVKRLRNGQHHR